MLQDGMKYKDGFGVEHTVMGTTKNNPDWVWTVQGCWYRRSDGRRIQYLAVDKSKPDGNRRHVAADRASSWDLIVK